VSSRESRGSRVKKCDPLSSLYQTEVYTYRTSAHFSLIIAGSVADRTAGSAGCTTGRNMSTCTVYDDPRQLDRGPP